MAKITEEMIRLDTQKSAGEVRAKLNELLCKAKSASAKTAINKMLDSLDTSGRAANIKAIEADRAVRRILSEYETECLHECNAEMDEGTCKIIEKIFATRSTLGSVTLVADKKTSFKAYRKKFQSMDKKTAKKNFEAEFELSKMQSESYTRQIDILGKIAKSYSLDMTEAAKKTQLDAIAEKVKKLKEQHKACKDNRERERLNGEYRQLLSEKDECDTTLARILNAKRNVDGINRLTEEYRNQVKIAAIDNTSEDEILDLVAKLTTANKKEIKRNETVSNALDEYAMSRAKFMDSSVKISGQDLLGAEIERDRAAELDALDLSAEGDARLESLDDLDIEVE